MGHSSSKDAKAINGEVKALKAIDEAAKAGAGPQGRSVTLRGMRLTQVPVQLKKLVHLEELNLRTNRLGNTELQLHVLVHLPHLRVLDLGANPITVFPSSLASLTNLTDLNMSFCQMKEISEFGDYSGFKKLKKLSLDGSKLQKIPKAFFAALSELEVFSANNNQLTELDDAAALLKSLKTLRLTKNKMVALPAVFHAMTKLETIECGENMLGELPASMQHCVALQTLLLFGNQLQELPEWMCSLRMLTTLDLSDNKLVILPDGIGLLTNLKNLLLNNNRLRALPPTLANLATVEWLKLNHNSIQALPAEMGQLTTLTRLHLSDNELGSVPPELSNIVTPHLREFELNRNPIVDLPEELKKAIHGYDTNKLFWSTSLPDQIVDGLFLGPVESASLDILHHRKITHIVRLLREKTPPLLEGFEYLWLQVLDNPNQELGKHFEQCFQFIHKALSGGGRVLVHCAAGISRSSTIVAAYLMKANQLSMEEALAVVRRNRPIVLPNRGFIKQLLAYQDLLQLSKETPEH